MRVDVGDHQHHIAGVSVLADAGVLGVRVGIAARRADGGPAATAARRLDEGPRRPRFPVVNRYFNHSACQIGSEFI